MGAMSTITLSRSGTLAGILATAYRAVPAGHLLTHARASHGRSDYATAYDAAVFSLTEAGLTRDTMPGYAAKALDELRHAAVGTSGQRVPTRQQQLVASVALADAMSRLLIED